MIKKISQEKGQKFRTVDEYRIRRTNFEINAKAFQHLSKHVILVFFSFLTERYSECVRRNG